MLIIKDTDPDLEPVGWDSGYNPRYNYKGLPFTGLLQGYEDDGVTLATEAEHKDGYWDGMYKTYYASGMLKSEGKSYGPTAYSGEYEEYYESGKLKAKLMYASGSLLSGEEYDEEGNVIKIYPKREAPWSPH